jgi:molecular chaperone GrpE (heat shock protein)
MNKTRAQLVALMLMALLSASAFAEQGSKTKKPNAAQPSGGNQNKSAQRQPGRAGSNPSSATAARDKPNAETAGKHEGEPVKRLLPGEDLTTAGSIPAHDHPEITQQLAGTLKTSDPISYLNDTKALAALAILILLALGLHVAQVFLQMQTRQRVMGLQSRIQRLSSTMLSAEPRSGKASAAGNSAEQLGQQRQQYQQISAQLEQIEKRLAENGELMTETVEAVTVSAQWMGQSQIDGVINRIGDQTGEADSAQTIRILGRYKEVFSFNVERVRPLCEAMRSFIESAKTRPYLPAELTGRAQALYHDIQQVDRWHTDVTGRLDSLQRGSLADRLSTLRSQHGKLAQQFYSGTISIADYVRDYQQSFERHLPKDAEESSIKLSPAEYEAELKRTLTGMPDYLMNWFDDLFQLLSQVTSAQASDSLVDAQTAAELNLIKKIARDVLVKFDVQPEEIQIGQTSYDRRLHDAELIAQSAQFPANTVIGVNQCGFRKVSTGEVLRRPRVIVAGVGAI